MADQIYFEQNDKLYLVNNPAIESFVNATKQLGVNVSGIATSLSVFFKQTKIFLEALNDPLASALIPLLNSLIAQLEDAKNIGAGFLTVWPWECGTLPRGVDPSKLQKGLLSLASAVSRSNPDNIRFDAETGEFFTFENDSENNTVRVPSVDQIRARPENTNLSPKTRETILSALSGVMDYTFPETWRSEFPEATKIALGIYDTFPSKRELTPSQVVEKIVDSLKDQNDQMKPYGTGSYIADVYIFAFPSFTGLTDVLNNIMDYFGGLLENEALQGYLRESETTKDVEIDLGKPAILKSSFFINDADERLIKDGEYKTGNVDIPMFSPGDIVVQGDTSLVNFKAEVVEHQPIIIKDAQVLSNRIKIRNISGEYKTTSFNNGSVKSTGIIRRLGKSDTENSNLSSVPCFFPENNLKPTLVQRKNLTFTADIQQGDVVLKNVLPLSESKAMSKFRAGGLDSYTDNTILDDKEFQSEMIEFVQKMKIGSIIRNPFLKNFWDVNSTGDLYDKVLKNEKYPDINYGKLFELLPDFGLSYHVADITIGDKSISNVTLKDDLFIKNEKNPKKVFTEKMSPINIVLGRLSDQNQYSTDGLAPFINPPSGVTTFDTNLSTFNVFTSDNGELPNWNFLRIQDIFPDYGEMIDSIIDFVEGVKSYVESSSKILEGLINLLDKIIEEIDDLNKRIQRFLKFLTSGFNAVGLYHLHLDGTGGVKDFEKKLKSAQFKITNPNPFPEIVLETVTETKTQINPTTGLTETFEIQRLKPTVKKKDRDEVEPQIVSINELDSLKYSGGLVLYAQDRDKELYEQFAKLLGVVESYGQNLISFAQGKESNLVNDLKPKLEKVQIQDIDGNFVDVGSADAKSDTLIRLVIKNNSIKYNAFEKNNFNEAQSRQINYSPQINVSGIKITTDKPADGAIFNSSEDDVSLFLGNDVSDNNGFFRLSSIPSSSEESIQINSGDELKIDYTINLDFTPSSPLPSTIGQSSQYRLRVKNLTSFERLIMDETTTAGFDVLPTTISDVEFDNGV